MNKKLQYGSLYVPFTLREEHRERDQDIGGWIILDRSWRERMGWYGLDWSGSGQGQVESSVNLVTNLQVP
jgi:hypothetical protein